MRRVDNCCCDPVVGVGVDRMDDLLSEFLTETRESLEVPDAEFVKFEQDPSDADILSNNVRLVHAIKGTSGLPGLPRLETVTRAGQDVLAKFRDGDREVTPEAATLVLTTIDTIIDPSDGLKDTGSEPDGNDSELIGWLWALQTGMRRSHLHPDQALVQIRSLCQTRDRTIQITFNRPRPVVPFWMQMGFPWRPSRLPK